MSILSLVWKIIPYFLNQYIFSYLRYSSTSILTSTRLITVFKSLIFLKCKYKVKFKNINDNKIEI